MSDDLVKRLRGVYKRTDTEGETYTVRYNPDGPESADRIEELEAKLAKAVEALGSIAIYGSDTLSGRTDGAADARWYREGVREMRNRARTTLAEIGEGHE